MKQRRVASRPVAPLVNLAISELAVMVRFGELVVALAAERVARIVLADEAAPAPPRATPRVRIGDAVLPAWNLGALLGLGDPPAAWLVFATGDAPSAAHIALATGPCIAVASHDGVAALPGGVVSAPAAAVVGVFATDPGLRERGAGPLGVRIDPLRLIGPSALAAAQRGER